MKLGLQFTNFTHSTDPAQLGPALGAAAKLAEEVGYERLAILDHHWQNDFFGRVGGEMLEPYATLAYLAAYTRTVELVTVVTNPLFRTPPMLARTVSTVDALSGGRAILGVGAGSHQEDVEAAGLEFPDAGARLAGLEEALRLCLQMWSDDDGPFEGERYRSTSTRCSPTAVGRPRPRILIGGRGEKKLLRLVAIYADEYNFSMGHGPVDLELVRHKLAVLAEHCRAVGRNPDEIVKTGNVFMEIGTHGEGVPQLVRDIETYAEAGMTVVHGTLVADGRGIAPDLLPRYVEMFGEGVIAKVAAL